MAWVSPGFRQAVSGVPKRVVVSPIARRWLEDSRGHHSRLANCHALGTRVRIALRNGFPFRVALLDHRSAGIAVFRPVEKV
jgi:hypothetical protein